MWAWNKYLITSLMNWCVCVESETEHIFMQMANQRRIVLVSFTGVYGKTLLVLV